MDNSQAEAIAEDLLIRTGKAMMARDADAFLPCFKLPQLMETTTGRHLVTSREELLRIFENMHRFLKRSGVVKMHRTVVAAEFKAEDMIISTHVSRLIVGDGSGNRSPFPVQSVLRRYEDGWKIASSIYVIFDSPEHNDVLMPVRSLPPALHNEA